MSIGIDKLAHMNTPALSDALLAHSAAEGTGVIAIGDLPELLNAGNLKMPDSEETIAEQTELPLKTVQQLKENQVSVPAL